MLLGGLEISVVKPYRSIWPQILAVLLLVWAPIRNTPETYDALRWIVSGVLVYGIWQLQKARTGEFFLTLVLAVLLLWFRPIWPVHSTRAEWLGADFIAITFLGMQAYVQYTEFKERKLDDSAAQDR